MPLKPAALRARLTAVVAASAALLLLGGCSTDSSSAAAAAAAAKPLSQQAFVTRQLGLSNSDFAAYVRQQGERLDAGTAEFVVAYEGGDDQLARALYAPTRVFYGRVLAVGDAFPDLDVSLDGDGGSSGSSSAGAGASGSGWHAIELDLFGGGVPLGAEQRLALGQSLSSDTAAVSSILAELRPSIAQQTGGVSALLAGRATAAAAGQQEPYSHTDLYDLQAYVDGAREVFDGVRPILVTENAALATTLDHRFQAVEGELNGLRTGVAFPGFDTLSEGQTESLQHAVADLNDSFALVTPTMNAG